MVKKVLYLIAGTICLALGILGIFVPGLPTTPFLLLTAALYLRSSERLHRWLIHNRMVGPYITEWQRTKGLTIRTKIKSVVLMSLVVAISVIFMIESTTLKIVVILAGLVGILSMGLIIRTVPPKDDQQDQDHPA